MVQCIINVADKKYIFTNLVFCSLINTIDSDSKEILKDIFLEFKGIHPTETEDELRHIDALKLMYNNECVLHIQNLTMNKYVNEPMHERFKTSQFKLQYRYNQEDVYVSSIANL